MSAQQNEALARRYAELFGAGDLDALAEELFGPGFMAHFPGAPDPMDLQEWKEFSRPFVQGFSGLHLEVEGLVAVADEAVARAMFSGEHTGEFQGIPPTGREVRFGGMAWFRIDDEGKIVEHWGQFDAMGMMQQLGVMEPPSA
jgi:steroid delta-isomerase-like uncharacterized protein